MSTPLLTGASVVLTRQPDSNESLAALLREQGATVVEVPLVAFAPPIDAGESLREAVGELAATDWLAVLSPEGARRTIGLLGQPPHAQIAVVGDGTAAVFNASGWKVSMIAEEASAVGLAADLLADAPPVRLVAAQSDIGRPDLANALSRAGWQVDQLVAYRNIEPQQIDSESLDQAQASQVVVFASPSAVERFVHHCGVSPSQSVCFGRTTADAAKRAGFEACIARRPDDEGVLAAITEVVAGL